MILLEGVYTKIGPQIKNKYFQVLKKIFKTGPAFMFHIETKGTVHILGLSRRLVEEIE
jgi:hypothetical protein